MTNKQKVSKKMRPVYLDLILDVVKRLELLQIPVSIKSVRRLSEARHVGFDLSDADIQPVTLSDKYVPMSLF